MFNCLYIFMVGFFSLVVGSIGQQIPMFSANRDCQVGISYNINVLQNNNYALIKLPDIQVSDDCGIAPKMECLEISNNNKPCQYTFGKKYQFKGGNTKFLIRATGISGYNDCRFDIRVASRAGCVIPTPPDNSAVVYSGDKALVLCRFGYGLWYPPILSCQNGEWRITVYGGSKLSDVKCTAGAFSWYTYHGDCNQANQNINKIVQIFDIFDGETSTLLCGQKI